MSLGKNMAVINNFMKWSQKARAKSLKPLFGAMTTLHIRPNHITFFRALAGPLFVLLFVDYAQAAVWVIVIASILDWFDGGLARYQKRFSDRGKFWDVLIDHLNYVFPVFALMLIDIFNPLLIGYHLLIVPVLYLLAVLKESEGKKTDWIIRPYYTIIYFKPVALLAIILFAFFAINWVNQILLGLNIAMTVWALYYTLILARRWR